MQKVLNIVPYPFLPYFSGGQKLIAHFNQFLGEKTELYVIGTNDNHVIGNESYTFLPWLAAGKWRYVDFTVYARIKKLILSKSIDTVIIEHPYLGWLGTWLKISTSVKLIYHTHNVEFARFRSLDKFWWPLLKQYEKWSLLQADLIGCISNEDKDLFIKALNIPEKKCHILPYGVLQQATPINKEALKEAICKRHSLDAHKHLLFFNGLLDYAPNTEALKQILENINPLLQQSGLQYEILIAGKRLPASFQSLEPWNKVNVHYAGFVEDIDAYTTAADVLLNPVITGGGVKTKVVEAIALNTSVVSTQSGATGIETGVCGNKISIVNDYDWQNFVAAISKQLDEKHITPTSFYDYYYWGNIVNRFLEH
ncbi:MAG: glycosyltransferase family 4 protein [Chitinophagaceae bacterium]